MILEKREIKRDFIDEIEKKGTEQLDSGHDGGGSIEKDGKTGETRVKKEREGENKEEIHS